MLFIEIPVFQPAAYRNFTLPFFEVMHHSDPELGLLDGYEGNHTGELLFEPLSINLMLTGQKKTTGNEHCGSVNSKG